MAAPRHYSLPSCAIIDAIQTPNPAAAPAAHAWTTAPSPAAPICPTPAAAEPMSRINFQLDMFPHLNDGATRPKSSRPYPIMG